MDKVLIVIAMIMSLLVPITAAVMSLIGVYVMHYEIDILGVILYSCILGPLFLAMPILVIWAGKEFLS